MAFATSASNAGVGVAAPVGRAAALHRVRRHEHVQQSGADLAAAAAPGHRGHAEFLLAGARDVDGDRQCLDLRAHADAGPHLRHRLTGRHVRRPVGEGVDGDVEPVRIARLRQQCLGAIRIVRRRLDIGRVGIGTGPHQLIHRHNRTEQHAFGQRLPVHRHGRGHGAPCTSVQRIVGQRFSRVIGNVRRRTGPAGVRQVEDVAVASDLRHPDARIRLQPRQVVLVGRIDQVDVAGQQVPPRARRRWR